MNMNNDVLAVLKITKIEKRVKILMKETSGETANVTLFVSEYSPFHTGPETIEELLNNGPSFIPSKSPEGIFRILNRDKILYVMELEPLKRDGRKNLRLYFGDGLKIDAAIFEALPEHYGRTIDFLNSNRTFLPLLYDSSRIYINKENIIKVEEL